MTVTICKVVYTLINKINHTTPKIEGGPVPKSVHTGFKVLHTHVNDDMPDIPFAVLTKFSH